jgi:hypothetical protein
MSTYSQDGFTADPSTPVYEDISMDGSGMPTTGTSTDYAMPTTGTASGSGGKKDAAKDEAAGVAKDAAAAGKQVAGTAKEQAKKVTTEATTQVKSLLGQAGSELKQQASTQQDRVAQGIRALGEQLSTMASSADDGPASQLVRTVAGRADSAASWLEARDPGSLLGEVKNFARRRPGIFIGIAAVAGIVAGRLTTSLVTEAKEQKAEDEAAARFAADDFAAPTNVMPVSSYDSPLSPSPEIQGESAFPPVSAPSTGTGLGTAYPTGGYAPGDGFEGTEGSRL